MKGNKKSVLIVCFSNLEKDPRVRRQVDALKDEFSIITAGLSPTGYEDQFISLKFGGQLNKHWNYPWMIRKGVSFYQKLKQRLPLPESLVFEWDYWDEEAKWRYKQCLAVSFDLVIANDLTSLPLCSRLAGKKNAKLLFDAHEYYPLEFERNKSWIEKVRPRFIYYCKKYIPKADAFTVVSQTIGERYKVEFECRIYKPKRAVHSPAKSTMNRLKRPYTHTIESIQHYWQGHFPA